MSYGTNASSGLNAVRTITNATWNGGTTPYLINSGYNQNIWKNDPVFMATTAVNSSGTGYIASSYDRSANNYNNYSILGVSAGCEYIVPSALVPVDNANPGRPVWLAGTATVGGVPAVINLIVDPNLIYDCQTTGDTGVGATQNNVGNFATIAFSVSAGLVQGNSQLGTSSVTVNLTGITPTAGNFPVFINGLSNYPNNVSGQIYNNVEVIIAHHYFRTMTSVA
jgi:hypothetical protein